MQSFSCDKLRVWFFKDERFNRVIKTGATRNVWNKTLGNQPETPLFSINGHFVKLRVQNVALTRFFIKTVVVREENLIHSPREWYDVLGRFNTLDIPERNSFPDSITYSWKLEYIVVSNWNTGLHWMCIS